MRSHCYTHARDRVFGRTTSCFGRLFRFPCNFITIFVTAQVSRAMHKWLKAWARRWNESLEHWASILRIYWKKSQIVAHLRNYPLHTRSAREGRLDRVTRSSVAEARRNLGSWMKLTGLEHGRVPLEPGVVNGQTADTPTRATTKARITMQMVALFEDHPLVLSLRYFASFIKIKKGRREMGRNRAISVEAKRESCNGSIPTKPMATTTSITINNTRL